MATDNTTRWTLTYRGLDVALALNIPVATRIARTYTLILSDALNLDPLVARQVTTDMMLSLWYFLEGPLQDVWLYAANTPARHLLAFRLIQLRFMLIQAEQSRLGTLLAATNYMQGLPARMFVPRLISAVSPLELLARLCWQQANPAFPNLGAFVASLQGLAVIFADANTEGVPKVMFICAAHLPDFFVAESVSCWGTLTTMNGWCLGARLRRFRVNERSPPSTITPRTDAFHRRVVIRYNANRGPYPAFNVHESNDSLNGHPPAQKDRIIDARRLEMNQTAGDPAEWYDHMTHVAVPLSTSPHVTFQHRHRCFKCRAMYGYNILPGTELNTNHYFRDGNYRPLSCAEVLCHCFCTRDEDVVEEQKTKKQRLDKPSSRGGGGGGQSSGSGVTGGSSTVFGGGFGSSSSVLIPSQ